MLGEWQKIWGGDCYSVEGVRVPGNEGMLGGNWVLECAVGVGRL